MNLCEPRFKEGDKLYVITRQDMPPGAQLAQAIHAKDTFSFEHPTTNWEWYEQSNYICVLSVGDEKELKEMYDKAMLLHIECSSFWEPDLDGELTAIALEPGESTKELCKTLQLALK